MALVVILLVVIALATLAGPRAVVVVVTPAPTASAFATSSESPKPEPTSSPTATSAAATTCHARGPLPDPVCTPGALNPNVTQATIGSTICVAGWTGTVRPPTSYTNALKVQQMAAYGLTGTTADYEEDHMLPLELGGAPSDPKNLWPQPRVAGTGAAAKDTLENKLKRLVCAGSLQLAEAQSCILVDWVDCDRRMAGR